MKAVQKLALSDYLNDPTDIRLKIFIRSLNPDFNLTKGAGNDIKLILEDYRKDNAPSRLKLIESYVGMGKVKTPKVAATPSKLSVLTTSPSPEASKLKELNDALLKAWKTYKNNGGEENAKKIEELRQQVKEAEEAIGIESVDWTNPSNRGYNEERVKESEIALVKGVFGDWNKQGTYAWEIIHGNRPSFLIAASKRVNIDGFGGLKDSYGNTGMDYLLKLLEKHCGQPCRKFKAEYFFGSGSTESSGWKFTEIGSAMALTNEMTVNERGQNIDVNSIYAMPDIGALPR